MKLSKVKFMNNQSSVPVEPVNPLVEELQTKIAELKDLEKRLLKQQQINDFPHSNDNEEQPLHRNRVRPPRYRNNGYFKQNKSLNYSANENSENQSFWKEQVQLFSSVGVFIVIAIAAIIYFFPYQQSTFKQELASTQEDLKNIKKEFETTKQSLSEKEKELEEKDQRIAALMQRASPAPTPVISLPLTPLPAKAKVTIKTDVAGEYKIRIDKKDGVDFVPKYKEGMELDPGVYHISVWTTKKSGKKIVNDKRVYTVELTVNNTDINITIPIGKQ